jgi:hypothetical protein
MAVVSTYMFAAVQKGSLKQLPFLFSILELSHICFQERKSEPSFLIRHVNRIGVITGLRNFTLLSDRFNALNMDKIST